MYLHGLAAWVVIIIPMNSKAGMVGETPISARQTET